MATTSLKLPDSLKERIVKLAADAGKSTMHHGGGNLGRG